MKQLARLVDIYTMLAPYTKTLVAENAAKGTPVMRPLFLQYEDDPRSYTEQFEYLYGPDLLVAPVWQSGKTEWEVYLPSDEWTHLWTGEHYAKGPTPFRRNWVIPRCSAARAPSGRSCLTASVQSTGSKLCGIRSCFTSSFC